MSCKIGVAEATDYYKRGDWVFVKQDSFARVLYVDSGLADRYLVEWTNPRGRSTAWVRAEDLAPAQPFVDTVVTCSQMSDGTVVVHNATNLSKFYKTRRTFKARLVEIAD